MYEDFIDQYLSKKKVVFFGASTCGLNCLENWQLLGDIEYFCDNDPEKWNTTLAGKPVYPPAKLMEDVDNTLVVITSESVFNIYEQLQKIGVLHIYSYKDLIGIIEWPLKVYANPTSLRDCWNYIIAEHDLIEKVSGILSDHESIDAFKQCIEKRKYGYSDYSDIRTGLFDEYFCHDIFRFGDNEVFVDAGVLDGSTTITFNKILGNKLKKAYCFEPSLIACEKSKIALERVSELRNKYVLFNVGLYNRKCQSTFSVKPCGGSYVSDEGKDSAQLNSLDDLVDDNVTYIKMDIEGSEALALEGAKKIIQTCKPKLAICLYHRIFDLWRIPLLVHDILPEYRLYIRNHTNCMWDTVLYATV
jgi:FkbM family methyltransferase